MERPHVFRNSDWFLHKLLLNINGNYHQTFQDFNDITNLRSPSYELLSELKTAQNVLVGMNNQVSSYFLDSINKVIEISLMCM